MLPHLRDALAAYRPRRIEPNGMPRAAVLIALYDKAAVQHVLFQVRTELVLHHKGRISFPGGAEDPGDADLLMTALRETEEEIGLAEEDVEVLGQLDDLVTVSDFVVTPYVGRITRPAPYPFAPSGYEVAELLEVPVPHLLDPATQHDGPARWRDVSVPPPSYRYGEHLIWGATARLLRRFLDLASVPAS
ncbi:MAG: CoA pyrophosphatase [Dehalococcoidia bacterium]|nr:CoA pyrophosphatase [Dehalococcoidia bacterium]